MTQNSHSLGSLIRIKFKRQLPVIGKVVPRQAKAAFHRRRFNNRLSKAWKQREAPTQFLPAECKVNAMVAGAQKAGTSALMWWLSQHPEVVTPVIKEPNFFDNPGFFNGPDIPTKAYHRAFAFEGKDKVYIEGTPKTMFDPKCLERVHRYNPSAKLICILRDPTIRAFSAWNMNSKNSDERDLRTLFHIEKERIMKDGLQTKGYLGYFSRGLYAKQVKQMRHWFPKEQLLFIPYERLITDNQGTFEEVCTFLDIAPPPSSIAMEKKNVIPYSEPLDPMLEQEIRNWFKTDIEALEGLLGWDLSHWK